MEEPGFEEEKDELIQTITDSYARGGIDMPAFERAVTRITASGDRSSLVAEAAALGLAVPAPALDPRERSAPAPAAADAVQLSCVSSNLRETGDWVRSRRYELALKSASARLDLREYDGVRGFRLVIAVDAVSSNLRVIVPEGFEVEDRLSERVSSTIRNRPRGESYGDNLVVITGSVRSSNVRVKYL
jgi:hypothetical protein